MSHQVDRCYQNYTEQADKVGSQPKGMGARGGGGPLLGRTCMPLELPGSGFPLATPERICFTLTCLLGAS